jgi:putative peptidoglycan lipid II flippase
MNNRIIAKTAVTISFIILLSKFSGFLRDVTLAYAFGTSVISDAYILAQSIISVFSSLLFIALGLLFIPVYSKLKLNENESDLNKFVDSVYSVAGTIIIVIGILGIIKADVLVFLFAPGFSLTAHEIAVTLTRILLPTILLSFISTIQGQQLRANNIFIPVACTAFPTNIALIIAFLFITKIVGMEGAVYAFVFGSLVQVACYIFYRK